ncbi:MAG: linear amide C-N hydrolase, partial [Planctomycetota bacterium]
MSCTSFGIAHDGRVAVGNNDDWFSVSAYLVVNKRNITKQAFVPTDGQPLEWTSKYGSVGVDYNAIGIPSAGMNEAGLVIDELFPGSVNIEYEPADKRPEVDEIVWIQYQLDNCATVEEVIRTRDVIRVVPYYWHSHYFVYDRNGDAATIGFADGQMVVTRLPPGGVQCLANRPYQADLEDYRSRPGEAPSQSGSSAARFRAAAELTRPAAVEAADNASLIEHAFRVLDAASTKATAISWVYDPKTLRIHYTTRKDGTTRWVDLTKFDFRGTTPMLVVDVNVNQSGDITSLFEPYRPELNRELVLRTIKDWRKHGF